MMQTHREDDVNLRTGERIPSSALEFATSRSGGPGGQNVNKVETRVEVRLDVRGTPYLNEETRTRLIERLERKLDKEGFLRVVSSTERSQRGNKLAAVRRLEAVLNHALTPRKTRTATKPTYSSKLRRSESKRRDSEKKARRRWKGEE